VNDGRSWSTAYGGLQEAIEAAQPGDELWVAAGIYYENVTVTPGLALYGGFAGSEIHQSERDWVRHPSILDGRRAGSVIVVTGAESADSRIDGFTIQNGEAEYGGGLLIANASPVIANNLIRLNRATNGAGIWLAASGAVCEGNRIEYNTATEGGGGLAMTNGSVTIRSNVFLANEAYNGGAIDAGAGEPLIEWNRIQENWTSRSAGGVRLESD
jgi:predicted outer membrane repeat protein